MTHECEKHQDGLVVVTTTKACPPLNCPAVSSGSRLPSLAQCGRGWRDLRPAAWSGTGATVLRALVTPV